MMNIKIVKLSHMARSDNEGCQKRPICFEVYFSLENAL